MVDIFKKCVQEEYAQKSICYGCGPLNKNGLQIKSYRSDKGLDLWFKPKAEHQAFPGVVNGGIIGTIFDCHGNWTAAISIFDNQNLSRFPSTVTANFSVNLLRPTPFGETLYFTGETQTLSAAIYTFLQIPNGDLMALRLTIIAVFISIFSLLLSEMILERLSKYKKRYE